jgi:hypothetical protein
MRLRLPTGSTTSMSSFVTRMPSGSDVLLTIWGTPGWANGGAAEAWRRTTRDLRDFAIALAARYSGRHPGLPFVRFYPRGTSRTPRSS